MSENSQETTYTAESDIDGIQAEIVFTGETGRMLTEFVEAPTPKRRKASTSS